jgi:hypothetical protein
LTEDMVNGVCPGSAKMRSPMIWVGIFCGGFVIAYPPSRQGQGRNHLRHSPGLDSRSSPGPDQLAQTNIRHLFPLHTCRQRQFRLLQQSRHFSWNPEHARRQRMESLRCIRTIWSCFHHLSLRRHLRLHRHTLLYGPISRRNQ